METKTLAPAELAKRWKNKVTVRTLANWRSQGKGPRFLKIGRSVNYPLAAVIEWEREQTK